ncbi:MAG: Fic family protein [Anaerolineae bacterium]|nr:Fic family protein [Anaerolineae bacterium]MDQ7035117.1 Fic family protein [Anaerolineae bacterium]
MRTYQKTHSWINFKIDLQQADYKLWLLLGEAAAKCEHVAGVLLQPKLALLLHTVFLTKGVYSTTTIEGNTLTEEEVKQRLEGKLKLPSSKEYLGLEIDNVLEAYNLIGQKTLEASEFELSVDEIKEYNRLVLQNLPLEEDVIPGEIRQHNVTVARYLGAPPEDLSYLLEETCKFLNDFTGITKPAVLGILKAIIAHLHIAWIHPFADGNGRTARLVEFQILLSAGIPTTSAHLLSNHYNETRSEYYRYLALSSKDEQGILAFIQYALQGFVDNLDMQIKLIEAQQRIVSWRDYIFETFRMETKGSLVDNRRRKLILDLSDKFFSEGMQGVHIPEIRYISPRIAEAYADKTDKTVQNDISKLEKLGLVVKTIDGIQPNIGIMLAFLPQKRINQS